MIETAPIGTPPSWRAFSLSSGRGICSPALDFNEWLPWLERLPGRLRSGRAREIRYLSLLSTGRRTFQVGGRDEQPLIVKCYPGTPADTSSSPDGSQHSRSSWDAFCCNQDLWQRNVPVPEPLIFLETSGERSRSCCYVITRQIEGCQPLFEFIFDQVRRRAVSRPCLEKWRKTIVESIVNLHRSGYSHGDLHNLNLLVQRRNPGDGIRVFFIDFDACQPNAGTLPDRAQLRDLADLGASLHQLVPDVLLAKALAQYLNALRLKGRHRREHCLRIIRREYPVLLTRNRTLRQSVEEYHFALAEEQLRTPDPVS
jgi:tRNA A-37 threonylcarbamoyl transferase component Bud32